MKITPIHPGEVLSEDFLAPHHLTANALAMALRVPANRITDLVRGKRGITADTALRLARYFRTSPEFWMNLQARFDLETVRDAAGAQIDREVALLQA